MVNDPDVFTCTLSSNFACVFTMGIGLSLYFWCGHSSSLTISAMLVA